MRKLILAMNVSIDGFADHTVAVAADDELHDFYSRLLERTDIAVFGRATYELMEAYWPHAGEDPKATKSEQAFAERYNAIPKIVFSQTLKEARWNKTQLNRGNMVEELRKVKSQTGKYISVGGIKVSQECLRQGLIDELWLTVHPIIVAKGRRLFEGLEEITSFDLAEMSRFNSGVVALHYVRKEL